MLNIEKEKSILERSLVEENEKKETVIHMLEHTESKLFILIKK